MLKYRIEYHAGKDFKYPEIFKTQVEKALSNLI